MNIKDLLNKDVVCACGRTHRCDIRILEIGAGVLDLLPASITDYQRVLLIADNNTYPLCGKRTEALLQAKQVDVCLFQTTKLLVPDERAVAEIEKYLHPDTDLILGIGSGVINDLCKYVSFEHGIQSGIIATAPSMDGFASSGAAMILNGMKVTVTTHAPDVILCDTDILKNAPMSMIRSGYGDIIGKYSSLNDWRLSHLIRGEHFCPMLHDLVLKTTDEVRDCVAQIVAREDAAIQKLTEALVLIGMSLTLVGSTRPGSGSEHHLSHFFEIVGLIHGQGHLAHGTDVAYNTILTAGMREQICKLDEPRFLTESEEQRKATWQQLFGALTGEVEQLQEQAQSYVRDLRPVYREKWSEIKKILSDCPGARECQRMMEAVGLDFSECERTYGHDKICKAMLYGKDLKDRYSVLWVYYTLFSGCPETADYRAFDIERKEA